jgi:class 3 adenylate cyclase
MRQGLGAFVPADVRGAMARGEARREHCDGAVLVADVSGFTPLTEAYARRYGARRGAEEVAGLLDRVYGALVAEVDRVAGSVVEFAGDAVCCCFHDDDGTRALDCALRMQAATAVLRTEGVGAQVGVAVATGGFRRLAVGDPAVRVFEVVAGSAIDRMSAIARHAGGGDVLVDAETARRLDDRVEISGLRGSGPDRCATVVAVHVPPRDDAAAPPDLDDGQARPWVPGPVHERLLDAGDERGGHGELRSVVALFVRFAGIDYEAPQAGARLDAYVRFAQAAIEGLGGLVFNVAVDGKGSYLCAGFGAPVAHDNDPLRAAAAALAVRTPPPGAGGVRPAGIGLARGRMYAGTYGGATRRVFGLQGSKANLAARLMQRARDRSILVEEPLARLLADDYDLRELPAIRVKGRSAAVALRELGGPRRTTAATPAVAPGLVDRVDERGRIDALLRAVRAGTGGVVVLEGEPGIGKSRLVRHLSERARDEAIAVHAGAGDPIERGAPYHGWRTVFGAALGLGALPGGATQRRELVLERLAAVLGEEDAAGDLAPLFSVVAPVPLPDGPATADLSGEARAEATRDLLARTLAAIAGSAPTLVVIEDAHWLDSASLALATRIATLPGRLLLVLTTRPVAESARAELERLVATAGCERIPIGPLRGAEVRDLAARAVGIALPARVATLIESKAGGNPLFTRELALALRDRGLLDDDPRGVRRATVGELESPDSVEAVIASRVDRLPARAQAVLKIGSVLGTTFGGDVLRELAGDDVDDQLAVLEELDLLGGAASATEGELAFRHALIRDVVYEQLLYAQRRDLHRRAAEFLEQTAADAPQRATHATLAHHWERAEAPEHAAPHFARGGDAAFRAGAFRECVDMLERALELSGGGADPLDRARWQWQIAESCYRLGDLERCHLRAEQAIAAVDRPVGPGAARIVAAALRELLRQCAHRALPGRLPRRAPASEVARLRLAVEAQRIMAEVFYLSSDTLRSSYVALRSLNLAESLGPSPELAECYGAIGIIAGMIGLHRPAEHYGELAQRTAARVNDEFALAITVHQRCMYRSSKGPYDLFAGDYPLAVAGFRALGHKPRLRDALGICAIADHLFGRPDAAQAGMLALLDTVEPQESSLGVTWAHAWIGTIALRRGHPREALTRLGLAAGLATTGTLDMTSVNIRALSALAHLRCGEDAEARREEDGAWELVRHLGRRPTGHPVLDGYAALAELALAGWDAARSRAARGHARRRAREACRNLRAYERTFAIGGPARWLYEGEYELRRGRRERALRAWRRCRACAEKLDMRYELALAHAALGDHLAAGTLAGEQHRSTAARLLHELGMPAHTRAVTTRTEAG